MKIPVVGFDPSLTNWGIAEAVLDLDTGFLDTPTLTVIQPKKPTDKQVRQNTKDIALSEQLSAAAMAAARRAKAVFVEAPVGSQSARAMASYGVCVGILGSIVAEKIPLIEVTAFEVKKAFTNNEKATKEQMIAAGLALYPDANWPQQISNGKGFKKGDVKASAEHVADALAAIHAGVNTPLFQSLMRLLQKD